MNLDSPPVKSPTISLQCSSSLLKASCARGCTVSTYKNVRGVLSSYNRERLVYLVTIWNCMRFNIYSKVLYSILVYWKNRSGHSFNWENKWSYPPNLWLSLFYRETVLLLTHEHFTHEAHCFHTNNARLHCQRTFNWPKCFLLLSLMYACERFLHLLIGKRSDWLAVDSSLASTMFSPVWVCCYLKKKSWIKNMGENI